MAFTTIPSVGKLRAPVFSAIVTELRPLPALKVGDQTVNNSITLVNDAGLAVAVAASAAYAYELHLTYNSNGTANFKTNWTLPSGGTVVRSNLLAVAGANTQHSSFTGPLVGGLLGAGADAALDMWGYFTTSTTAGTLQLQWAQTVANVSDTIVRDGSFLVVRRLS